MYAYIFMIWRSAMNFIQVQGFILTAQHNSFATAAKELGVYQQNLTVYMRKMEDELGVSLFTSDKRGTQLTNKGKELLPLFETIASTYNTVLNKCQNKDTLKIGIDSIFYQPFICDYVFGYQKEFPESNTEFVSSGRYWELPERLKNGEIDLYFGYYRDDLDSLMFHEMFLDSVCIAYGKELFKNKKSVSLKDLEGLNIYYDNENLYKNKVLLSALDKKHINYNGVSGQADSIIDLHVINGEGVMIIHGYYISTLSPHENAIPVRGLKVPYGIFYRKNDFSVQNFIRYINM